MTTPESRPDVPRLKQIADELVDISVALRSTNYQRGQQIYSIACELTGLASSERGMPDWIPVGEKLPGTYETVLLNCAGELLSTGFLTSDGKFRVDAEDPSDGSAWAVTHWMPLPKAHPGDTFDMMANLKRKLRTDAERNSE